MTWQGAVERTVTALGYELVDTERSAGGLLRVTMDKLPGDPSGGFITVDDCEKVTRQLQHVLEVEACDYRRLEVSSPGLDRPLKKAADYQRFAGEQVEITLKLAFQGRKKYRGELQGHGEGWRLLLAPEVAPSKAGARPARKAEPAPQQVLDFSLDEVREARLVPVVDFKGRRSADSSEATALQPGPGAEVDGGRDR
jgi:ribosome maturation factor RimP